MDRSKDLDLMLMGKTGNGKSKTGNAILRWPAFKSNSSTTSVTKEIISEVTEYGGRRIKVVDGPGVGDTSGSEAEANRFVMEQLSQAIALNDKGYHAFLLVHRYGIRFERNDKNAVDFLKTIFSPNFIKKHCILLFSCGDNFEQEFKGENKTIQDWCLEQEGPFRELYEECDKRVVLFDNMTKDAEKINAQLDTLITMVDKVSSQNKRYTNKHFAAAKEARKLKLVQDKTAIISQETMEETSLILQKLEQICQGQDLGVRKVQLQQLQTRCEALHQKLMKKDKGTGALNELRKTAKDMLETVKSNVKECDRMIAERLDREAQQRQEAAWRQESERKQKILEEQYKAARESNNTSIYKFVVPVVLVGLLAVAGVVTGGVALGVVALGGATVAGVGGGGAASGIVSAITAGSSSAIACAIM